MRTLFASVAIIGMTQAIELSANAGTLASVESKIGSWFWTGKHENNAA